METLKELCTKAGGIKKASEILGMPYSTLRDWANYDINLQAVEAKDRLREYLRGNRR